MPGTKWTNTRFPKNELEYLSDKVNDLKGITNRICMEKILEIGAGKSQ